MAVVRMGDKSAAVEGYDGCIDDGSAHLAQLADAAEEADDAEGAHEADEPGGDRAVGQVQDRHAHHHHVQPVLRPQRGGRWGVACARTQKDRSGYSSQFLRPADATCARVPTVRRAFKLLFMPLRSPRRRMKFESLCPAQSQGARHLQGTRSCRALSRADAHALPGCRG